MKEKELIQSENFIAEKLDSFGWRYVEPSERLSDKSQPLSMPLLKESIRDINEVSEDDIDQAITYLTLRPLNVEGAKETLRELKSGIPITDKEGVSKKVKMIDYGNNTSINTFTYSRQVYYKGIEADIPDVVLYVNGIPLVLIECKSMKKSWKEAYSQVKRYEEEIPSLFQYVQFSLGVADKIVYFPNVRWSEDVPVYEWRDNGDEAEFLKPDKLLDILRYFTFYREVKGEISKVLPRYMQYRAVNKIVDRAFGYARGETDRNKGLIWHWQGSGKTLEMVFAAYKLSEMLGNPTVFFIVDRIDLQDQLSDELKSLGLSFEEIVSVRDLREVLTHADGKRGFFLTLMHKFRPDEFKELIHEVKKQRLPIAERKDVIAFIDEGHRTQYGDLAGVMRIMLNSASLFAFTGTPVSKRGRDTYYEFGYEDEPYLDRYFVLDALRDGFTVKIAYQARLDSEHLERELLSFFLDSELEEIPEEYEDRVRSELHRDLNQIKVILENPCRIETMAGDIADHYGKYIEPFKAMVVAVNRKACVHYKRALDKLLPPEYSEVVMTFGQEDEQKTKETVDYFKELTERYKMKDEKAIRDKIIEEFRIDDHNPKILIVTEMLLAGFDVSILQTMYLDKPLKEHRLLQAIARTNRPFYRDGEEVKSAGLVIDYVGIFKELKKAFAIYNESDITGVAYNLEEVKEELRRKIQELMSLLAGAQLRYDRETINNAIMRVEEADKGKEFERDYKEARNLYRLLREDRFEFKEQLDWLSEIYYVYQQRIKGLDPEIEQKKDRFLSKAMKFIHETIDMDKIRKDFPVVDMDEEFLKKVSEPSGGREEFAEILFGFRSYVSRVNIPNKEDIVQKVDRIVEDWRQRDKEVEALYGELNPVARDVARSQEERERLGVNEQEYILFDVLRKHSEMSDEDLLKMLREMIEKIKGSVFPGWWEKREVINDISRKLLVFLAVEHSEVDAPKVRDELLDQLRGLRWT